MDLFLNPNLQQEIMESILGRDHPPAKFRENHPLFKSFSVQIIQCSNHFCVILLSC